MKKKFLYVGLTSLFLLGCSKKVMERDYETIQDKIQAKEDFIFVLSSKDCGHCQNLKKNYNESNYNFNYYEIDFLSMVNGVKSGKEKDIETYKYIAELVEYSFSNVESFLLEKTYEEYFNYSNETSKKYTYSDINGKDDFLEGYVNLVTPLSFFYIDGQLVNFEYADYSYNLDKVMIKYGNMIENGIPAFNPYTYIHDLNFKDIENKIEKKEDFILVLSSKNCSWCNKQFDDIYNRLHLMPEDINYYYIDDLLVNLEKNLNDEPIKGEELYEQAKYEYRFFAAMISKIGDYILNEEGGYIKENYTERFGCKEPSIMYPVTFIYIDGEVSIELSTLGYGWSESDEKFKTFLGFYKNIKNL